MPKRKRPQIVTVTGDKWVKNRKVGKTNPVYNPGAGPAPVEEIVFEKFSDKELYEALKNSGGAGVMMASTIDLAAGYHVDVMNSTTPVRLLHVAKLLYSHNGVLAEGSFYKGTAAIFVQKQRCRTQYTLNDVNPVVRDMYIMLIEGKLYAADDLTWFEKISA